MPGQQFASVDKALDERTIGHNPERLCLMKVSRGLGPRRPRLTPVEAACTACKIPVAAASWMSGRQCAGGCIPMQQTLNCWLDPGRDI